MYKHRQWQTKTKSTATGAFFVSNPYQNLWGVFMPKYITIESNKNTKDKDKNKELMIPITTLEKEIAFQKKDFILTLEETFKADYGNFQHLRKDDEKDEIAYMLMKNIFRKLIKLGCTNFKI